MTKAEIRKYFLEKRSLLTTDLLQERSEHICKNFFANFDLKHIRYLHIFLPISKLKEIDTQLIIQKLHTDYKLVQVVIPKADINTFSMESYEYDESLPFETNKWGIPEPVSGKIIQPHNIDMILIPLLAFDTRGYRVGYGKGFYDRFLESCRRDIIKIGLSYNNPTIAITDINSFDVKMDFCITPEKIWQFGD